MEYKVWGDMFQESGMQGAPPPSERVGAHNSTYGVEITPFTLQ